MTVNILITGNHRHSSNASEWSPPPLARVSVHSVLVKIACRNKLCTQKGNPADLLNVLIRSQFFLRDYTSARRGRYRQILHQFQKGKGKKSPPHSSLISHCAEAILCAAAIRSLRVLSLLLISLPATGFSRRGRPPLCEFTVVDKTIRDLRSGCC